MYHEFEPVFRAVQYRLFQLVENRENFPEAEALFKVLYRFENCKPGRPLYPQEVNWQLIADYIIGPFQSLESLRDSYAPYG